MTAQPIDGTALATKIYKKLGDEVKTLLQVGVQPCLATVLVGDDPASRHYVHKKQEACKLLRIEVLDFQLNSNISQDELVSVIEELNGNEKVNSILVQLPLPNHIDETVLHSISPDKDVDGLHPLNLGLLLQGKERFVPCTPKGIIRLVKSTGILIESKHVVVLGRSNIVGKPTAILFLRENATVTICHSKTPNLALFTTQADILVVAIGKPRFVGGSMVKERAVVVDVGITKSGGKFVGDINFESVSKVARLITPVPGGVGPMTVAMLMENTVLAAQMQFKNKDGS
ncbi:MAG: methylenetetrahydrofolate dehydrogenase (NADP+) / methenyltetrahydrofolate cyclohydrolase [Parcubacteria group bacterium Gr01-1014_20]|nr:MAG: methylenetetrahydrofolate dehydrogenase (NADP+) / methenyltetrahydrofolate cyclohydrolase [Parcubacteria group bacterium Gr01-1014_20]